MKIIPKNMGSFPFLVMICLSGCSETFAQEPESLPTVQSESAGATIVETPVPLPSAWKGQEKGDIRILLRGGPGEDSGQDFEEIYGVGSYLKRSNSKRAAYFGAGYGLSRDLALGLAITGFEKSAKFKWINGFTEEWGLRALGGMAFVKLEHPFDSQFHWTLDFGAGYFALVGATETAKTVSGKYYESKLHGGTPGGLIETGFGYYLTPSGAVGIFLGIQVWSLVFREVRVSDSFSGSSPYLLLARDGKPARLILGGEHIALGVEFRLVHGR